MSDRTTNNSQNNTTFKTDGRIVIVGASLAGLRAAEALRNDGFSGQLTLIGDEPYRPYDRPPLSKQVLAGRLPVEHTPLAQLRDINAEWQLGVAANGLDLASKQVQLADGQRISFDRLLIATGTRARPWSGPEEAALDGVYSIRGRDDSQRLRMRLTEKPARVLVIGGGFIGSEVASVCRELDLPVTLVQRGPTPLFGSLGSAIGAIAADMQRQHNVDLRVSTTVTALEGDEHGQLHCAHLSNGETLDVDVAVIALGAIQNADWLQGSGLLADTRGVICDEYCRALKEDSSPADDIFVAGDVARTPNPLYDGRLVAVEHWGNAVAQGEMAAHNMVSDASAYQVYKHTPNFWSNQFGVNIKSVGLPDLADEVVITQGSAEKHSFVAAYGSKGRIVAVVAFNQPRWLEAYQTMIEARAAYPPDLHSSDQPIPLQSVPTGFPQVTDSGDRAASSGQPGSNK